MTEDGTGAAPGGSRRLVDLEHSWAWGLFADWCASWGRDPLPASRETLVRFLEAFPAARSTQVARLAVILTVHARAGVVVDAPRLTNPPETLWAVRPGLLDPPAALAQLPRFRFPVGLVGRRDGFLIVLTGFLGMTREQARHVTPANIEVDEGSGVITIKCNAVPMDGRAGECPRCAVAAWLGVIAPHYERLRGSYLPLLDPTTADPDVHWCEQPVGGLWRSGVALLPPIDRTGAVGTGGPISARAITMIVGRRRIPTGRKETLGPVVRNDGRFRDATSGQLAAAQDDVLNQVEQANRFLEELLVEAAAVRDSFGGGAGGALAR